MEMNTRLQVEHPVTEAITGIDLVEWQLRVAAGEPLPRRQEDIAIDGVAIEARLYAEDPRHGFLPSTGRLARLRLPDHLRVDDGFAEGDTVTAFYDPLIAKIVAHAPQRGEAARRLADACASVEVWPVRTNAALLARALAHADFLEGRIDTGFIERNGASLLGPVEPPPPVLAAAARALMPAAGDDPWTALAGFRLGADHRASIAVEIDGTVHKVALDSTSGEPLGVRTATVNGDHVVFAGGAAWAFGPPRVDFGGAGAASDGALMSPLPGRIAAVLVAAGDRVCRGQVLVVIEAMKMELSIAAPFDGRVKELAVEPDQRIGENVLLVRVTAAD
jgi:3-methylcrotonyl-CoA carboxylase alpha subunit